MTSTTESVRNPKTRIQLMNMDSHPYTWQVSDQHYLNIHELTFQMSESTANIFATIHTDANLGGTLSRVVL